MAAATHHSHQTRQGSPRSAAICSALSCRCGCSAFGRLRPAVLRVHGEDPARALPEHGLVADHVDARLPHVVAVDAAGVDDGEAVRRSAPGAGSGRRPPPRPAPTAAWARAGRRPRPRPDQRPQPGVARARDDERPTTRRGRPAAASVVPVAGPGQGPRESAIQAPPRGQAGHEQALRLDREQVEGLAARSRRRAPATSTASRAQVPRRGPEHGARQEGEARGRDHEDAPSPAPTPSCSGRGSCAGG